MLLVSSIHLHENNTTLLFFQSSGKNIVFFSNLMENHLPLTFFFLSWFFFTDTDVSHGSRGKTGAIFYSTLPPPPAHKHLDIYLQFCMWDDYHIFLITPLVFTRLLLDEIYHLIELPFEWLINDAMFVYLMNWY